MIMPIMICCESTKTYVKFKENGGKLNEQRFKET